MLKYFPAVFSIGNTYQIMLLVKKPSLKESHNIYATPWSNPLHRTINTFIKKSLAFQPNIVLLMLGTNDSKPWNWNSADYISSTKYKN